MTTVPDSTELILRENPCKRTDDSEGIPGYCGENFQADIQTVETVDTEFFLRRNHTEEAESRSLE